MKHRYIYSSLLILSVIFLCTGCYTKRPTASIDFGPDYNHRVELQAKYIQRKNPVGIGISIGTIGAAAYGGYALAPFKYQDGTEQKPIHALNAAAGALAGAGIVLITDIIMGRDKISYKGTPEEWLKKAQSNYKLIHATYNQFTIIDPLIEKDFKIRYLKDVKDFKRAFPNSQYENKIVKEATKNLSRERLKELISLYPTNANIENTKKTYIIKSGSVAELMKAQKEYPEVNIEYEKLAADKATNHIDAMNFFRYFPNSSLNSIVFLKGYQDIDSRDTLELYIKSAPVNVDREILNNAKKTYIVTCKNIEEAAKAYTQYRTLDKGEVIEKLSEKGFIKSLNDMRILKKEFGYVRGATEKVVKKSLDVIPAYSYYEIPEIYPSLETNLKNIILRKYESRLKEDFEKAIEVNDIVSLEIFIKTYKNKPQTIEKMAQAEYLFEYAYLKKFATENGNYITRCANFAKKYPKHFEEMDKIAFSGVDAFNPEYANKYIKYFPNGKYKKEAEAAMYAAAAYRNNAKCIICNGNGNCRNCNGRGTTICSSCDGTGVTYGRCNTCNGKGHYKCYTCHGNGRCTHCHGSGYQYK